METLQLLSQHAALVSVVVGGTVGFFGAYAATSKIFLLLVIYLPAWYLLKDYGNHGLWLAFILFNAARGASLQWCYHQLSGRSAWLEP